VKRPPIYRRGQTWYSTATRRSLGTKDRAEALKLERVSRRAAKETDGPAIGDAAEPVDSPRTPVAVPAPEAPPPAVDPLSPAGGAPSKPEGDPLSELGAEPAPPAAPALDPQVAALAAEVGMGEVMSPAQVDEVTKLVSPAVVAVVVKLTGVAAGWMRTTPVPPPPEDAVAFLRKIVDIKVTRALLTAQISENALLAMAVAGVFLGQVTGEAPPPPPPAEPSLH
jgi:hypothetical protein